MPFVGNSTYFTASPLSGAAPLTVAFTDESRAGVGIPTHTNAWDFGDGSTSSVANPVHTYTVAGTYSVTLTTTWSSGNSPGTYTATAYITVSAAVVSGGGGMSLPELTLPDGLPIWLNTGHAIELVSLYADIPMSTGHGRKRRVFTRAPRTVSVELLLSQGQMTALHNWFENVLQAGVQYFSTRVQNQGPGLLWWKALFVEPYTAEALHSGYWRVKAKLLLTGDGSVTGPYTPAMNSAVRIALSGSATIPVTVNLSAAITVALVPANNLSAVIGIALDGTAGLTAPIALNAAISVALLPNNDLAAAITVALLIPPTFRLREDGSFRLREDGSKRLREF